MLLIDSAMTSADDQRLAFFERYLSLWVALCMVAGIVARQSCCPSAVAGLRGLEFGQGSQINVPIAVLIWLMITPMMMKVDFAADPQRRAQAAPGCSSPCSSTGW